MSKSKQVSRRQKQPSMVFVNQAALLERLQRARAEVQSFDALHTSMKGLSGLIELMLAYTENPQRGDSLQDRAWIPLNDCLAAARVTSEQLCSATSLLVEMEDADRELARASGTQPVLR